MRKISEELDLSRQTLEIDIESPVLDCMLNDLNKEIRRVILKVYENEFKVGEISLKLNLEIPEGFKTIPKKTFKNDGGYTDERDVQLKDGKFVAVPLVQFQMSIYDLGEGAI